ncbi:Amidase [Penicillium italicum]|uniref:Amidase n=1 Tax=Penicillium italicum TaxID=40296 RepID=A0A0A2KRJ6_PENIT|nr:Amidase [Penicillium italicum]
MTNCISLKGQTVELNGVPFYLPSKALGTLGFENSPEVANLTEPLCPITFIDIAGENCSLDKIIGGYQSLDDVFNIGFLKVIFHNGHSNDAVEDLQTVKSKYGTEAIFPYPFDASKPFLPPGPYFWSPASGTINAAYRLYSDEQGAFTQGLIPSGDGSYDVIPAAVPGAGSMTIGVPSRLHYTKNPAKPLAGVRLGVKDMFDIAGIKSSGGNRAYYKLSPPANETALAIQKLIDAGAVLIGKMKTSQFANGEWATADWVDYHAPFNPRGDGYQDPGSSSSGPAAGVASYDWLDLTVGTDTGGSIRVPAGVNGVFGIRPSHDSALLKGIIPLSPEMDTVGMLTRNTTLWKEASKVLYGGLGANASLPRKLYLVDFPINRSSQSNEILLDFAESLADILHISAEIFDIENMWNSTAPKEANGARLVDFVGNIFPLLTAKEQFRLVGNKTYNQYKEENEGRLPFIDPSPSIRWNWGTEQPDTSLDQAFQNMSIFASWWYSHGQAGGPNSCSDSLFVYPQSTGDAIYRDGPYPVDSPGIPSGFAIDRVPSFVGSPDFTLPIGESEYHSRITNRTELLPVAVDLMGGRGCEGMVFNVIDKLVAAGKLKGKLNTGKSLDILNYPQ